MTCRHFALAIALLSLARIAGAQPPARENVGQLARSAEAPRRAQTKSPQQEFLDGERRSVLPKGQPDWSEIIEWFSEQSGLPFIGSGVPNGVFQRSQPEDAAYSCTEAIDIINEALGRIEYLLLRREGAFTVLPIDGPLNPNVVPLVASDCLDQYGKTEIVRIIVSLKRLNAADACPKVKQGLGPLGCALALTAENQLQVSDTAGKLLRLSRAIHQIEKEEGNSFSYKFNYLRARDAEESVRKLLDQLSPARAMDFDLPLPAPKIRSDERTNTIFISAPRVVMAQVVADVRKIDQPQPPGERPFVGPELRTFNVPAGNAELFIRFLSNLPQFRASSTFRMVAVSPDRIVVYALPDLRMQMEAALIACLVLPPTLTEGLSVTVAQGMSVVDTLYGFMGDSSKSAKRVSKTAAATR